MRNLLLLPILFISSLNLFGPIEAEQPRRRRSVGTKPTHGVRKKILMFSGHGGGGHLVASNALTSYLGNDYDIEVAFMFDEVLKDVDAIQKVTHGKKSGDDFYNALIKKQLHFTLNRIYGVGRYVFDFKKDTIKSILTRFIKDKQPDLIISVIPLVNNSLLKVAKSLNIPFLLLPTDLDATMALHSLHNPTYEKFRLGLSYNIPEVNKVVQEHGIPQFKIRYVGFPVNKCFINPKSCPPVDKEFGLPSDKPVVLLLMGSQGSTKIKKYVEALAKANSSFHLVIAIGKSEKLRPALEKIKFPSHITRTIVGFTDKMPQLLNRANLFITKTGGLSINEGIYSNTPMFLDATYILLRWEKLSVSVVTDHEFGIAIKRVDGFWPFYKGVAFYLDQFLQDPALLKKYRYNLEQLYKPNPTEEIPRLVASMIK